MSTKIVFFTIVFIIIVEAELGNTDDKRYVK